MKILRNENGFTLVEVIIASAMIFGLSLVLMQQSKMQSQISVTADTNADLLDFVSQIRFNLSSGAACSATFAGVSASSGTVQGLKRAYVMTNGATGFQDVFGVNTQVAKSLKIIDYKITGPTPNVGVASLEVHVQKTKSGVMGGSDIRKTINLNVTTDASGKIATCSTGSDSTSSVQSLCAAIAGASWNSTLNQCIVTPTDMSVARPAGVAPIDRSWLAPANVIRDTYALHNGANINGVRGNGNIRDYALPTDKTAICWPNNATLATENIPAVTYDRRVLVEAYVPVQKDSGGSDEGYVSMHNGNTLLDLEYFLTNEAHSLLLTSIIFQHANTPLTITIVGKQFAGGCAIYGKVPNWKIVEL